MESDYDRLAPELAGARPWLRTLLIAGFAFVAGVIAMGYVLTHWGAAQRYLTKAPPVAPIPLTMPRDVPQAQPLAHAPAPEVEQRLAVVEAKLGEIDRRANAAVGDADRAEGLLVAFAARRALDRGVDLGYIEGLLRERFGGSQPQAVATIISAARLPVTIDQLQSGLEEIAPALVGEGPRDSWWDSFRREIGGMVVVRRAGVVSAAPSDRIDRARRALEIGRVDTALAEVSRLPGRANAAVWSARARRYAASRAALDHIETAALLDPKVGELKSGPAVGAWVE